VIPPQAELCRGLADGVWIGDEERPGKGLGRQPTRDGIKLANPETRGRVSSSKFGAPSHELASCDGNLGPPRRASRR